MKRIIVLGCPGSGKSTFAIQLHQRTGLPLIHLDNIWWKTDRTNVAQSEFDERLAAVLGTGEWIIDGDYSRTYEARLKACDTVFFLDYGEAACMAGIRARVGRARPDMPWTEDTLDPELVEEVRKYGGVQRPRLMELLHTYPGKETHIFRTREEAEVWLANYRMRNRSGAPSADALT